MDDSFSEYRQDLAASLRASPEWGDYFAELVALLCTLGEGSVRIIEATTEPLRYVQFAAGASDIAFEAYSRNLTPSAAEEVFAKAGWDVPDAMQPNWSTTLLLPARTVEYETLAACLIAALRDGYGMRTPDELSTRGWDDPPYGGTDRPHA